MLCVLKRTVSMRRFFWAPKTYFNFSQFHTEFSRHIQIISESSRIETIWPIKKHPNDVTYI